ncbi:hypothetical protein [Amycolatopsis keratiniphila]|uniref:Uncharacterized protein n=1 Tax=Amycolatopsis keratiniphila subsp. keratiniphila TaxID=227715 RepID=A0A1W2M241_9PSEU|nr:hypothetical protein [Amycolatopsis keratiniphila]ONF73953.1 hypothetical protein AVR91_0204280 [Amycolatopsis keratiniphila subsp. keratiniphila]
MSQRPEITGGGYHHLEPNDGYDPDGWQDFTPWRPGDPSTQNEAPPALAAEFSAGTYTTGTGGRGSGSDRGRGREGLTESQAEAPDTAPRRRQPEKPNRVTTRNTLQHPGQVQRFEPGDKVRSRGTIAGQLGMDHVPTHTKGRVLDTRQGLLGGSFATVAFENGYVEEIQTDAIERRGFFD